MTGAIAWPVNFRDAEYQSSRETLERLYHERATAGYLTSQQHAKAMDAIEAMDENLKKNIRNYVPQNYVALKSFLGGLRYELVAPATLSSELLSMVHRQQAVLGDLRSAVPSVALSSP